MPQIARRGIETQATTKLFDSTSWWPLEVPGNHPFLSATNFEEVVENQIIDAAQKLFRVHILEP